MDFSRNIKESVTPLVNEFKERALNPNLGHDSRYNHSFDLVRKASNLSCGKRRYLLREVKHLSSGDAALDKSVVSMIRELCTQAHLDRYSCIPLGSCLSVPLGDRVCWMLETPSKCCDIPVFKSGVCRELGIEEIQNIAVLHASVRLGCIKSLNTFVYLAIDGRLPERLFQMYGVDHASAVSRILHMGIEMECEDVYIFKETLCCLILTDTLSVPENIRERYEVPSISNSFQLRVSQDNLKV